MAGDNIFVDGEPIDAAKLQRLVSKVNQLQSLIPTWGDPTTIAIDARTITSGPEIEMGDVATVTIKAPKFTYPFVSFMRKDPFSGIPKVVICLKGGESIHAVVPRVVSVTPSGFTFALSAPDKANGYKVGLSYIAMYYPS